MKRKSDFTFVELVIVIAIFAIAAVVFNGCCPPLATARERSHQTSCRNNLKQIGTALEIYSSCNRDWLPAGPAKGPEGGNDYTAEEFYTTDNGRAAGFELLRTNDFLTDYMVYICPSSSAKAGKGTDSLNWAGNNLSYAYKPGMVKGDSSATGRPGSGVCADLTGDLASANKGKSNHKKFGNILCLDGHVMSYDGAGWFSPVNVGYPTYEVGTRVMIPNTLRDARTGKAN